MIRAIIKVALKITILFLFRVKVVRKRKYRKRKNIYNMPKSH